MTHPQLLLDTHDEMIVDLFAGGGGASLGIEMATGRMVDVAINHDPVATSMHRRNHPTTDHHVSDVFEVDPREVSGGRPIGLLWASPDCTDHSKAKGGKPIRTTKRRALAWVVKRWAGQVRPRVIMLENVEEFVQWGPLVGMIPFLRRCPKRKGRTFRRFVRDLEALGYAVEWRELRACDYGAPTIRKRLFLIARCDGQPIVWPEKTHGPGTRRPWKSAASCIDWSIPMCSIFATREEARAWGKAHGQAPPKRPLAEKTMARIARGVKRFVLDAAEPFIVGVGGRQGQSTDEEPSPVVVPTGNGASLVAGFLAKHFGGVVGSDLRAPKGTITTIDHDGLVAASLAKLRGTSTDADPADPLDTISAGGTHHAAVAAFLSRFNGMGTGGSVGEPAQTLSTKDRLGLVAVTLKGIPYILADIAMRMLQPRELFRCQGFPDSYVIDRGADGRRLTKSEQVRLVGNSVSPQHAAALVRANCRDLIARDEARRSA